jgi:RHS repeat-associated protein
VSWNPAPAQTAPAAAGVSFAYRYNFANQRTGQTASDQSWWFYPTSASAVSYTSNSLDQYTAVGAVVPTYDGNGNLTSDGTYTFGYDPENRLITASGAGNSASYAFDSQGRRKSKTVNGASTFYVTDADNREVLEYDGTSGQLQRLYTYGPGLNDVLNSHNIPAATRVSFIPDVQGSMQATLDSGTGVLAKAGYQPFGQSASATGSFRYTGQRIDVETGGLYYYRARMYSPLTGRFLQGDPSGTQGGSNFYAYVLNDPLNLVDPLGLSDSPAGSFSAGVDYVINNPGQVVGAALLGAAIATCSVTPCLAAELAIAGGAAVISGVTVTATGVAAGAAIATGTVLMSQSAGDKGGSNEPDLQRIHPDSTYESGSAKYDLNSIRQMPSEDIVRSLAPGSPEPLTVGSDGRIFDGNTRVKVLQERGYDVNSLPRTPR